MAIKCCYKCQDRQIYCHSTCKRYISEKTEYDAQKEAHDKQKRLNDGLMNQREKAFKKIMRGVHKI